MCRSGRAGQGRLAYRRPARQGGRREPRAGAVGAACVRPVAAAQEASPSISRPPTCPRKAALRSADRARPDGGARRGAGRRAGRLFGARRTLARRHASPPVAGVLPAAIAANAHGTGLICPARMRAGGGLGRRGRRHHRARQPDRARQSFPRHAGAVAAAAGAPRTAARTCPISPTSRARRPPSARSRSPPPAGTIS